jgi:hypothetical protein
LTPGLKLEYLQANQFIIAYGRDMKTRLRLLSLAILVIACSVIPARAQDLGPGFAKIKDGIRLEVSEAELM